MPVLILLLAFATLSVQAGAAPVWAPEILRELPHDEDSFTQGLFLHAGRFYESTGLRGRSRLMILAPESGHPVAIQHLPPYLFGEGADLCGDEVVQLTWTSGIALRYAPDTLSKRGEFHYSGEGWGLACQDATAVTSNGSALLTFRALPSFEPERELRVTDADRPIERLNELEWVDGLLLANVWQTNRIAAIDPTSGAVLLWLDLSEAASRSNQRGDRCVLNGSAWDPAERLLYVTGKCWKSIYVIELAEHLRSIASAIAASRNAD